MHRHFGARAGRLAVAAIGLVVSGCMGGKPSGASTSGEVAKGVPGSTYYVNLFTPPIGGIVTSEPAGISCGASSLGTPVPDANGILQYAPVHYPGADRCGVNGQTPYPWSQTVVLTATAQGQNVFIGWAGDCGGSGPTCTLSAGADKTVAAIFGPAGSGHPDYSSPALHGPAYLDFLGAGQQAALVCTKCHGANLQGQGIAPSCNACHEAAGWTGWSTNCSFCHGARNASTRPGYVLASHPTWSAPPDAVSQRLSGVPDASRTGAHQAHLTGATSTGLRFAAAFTCQTCHAVPADLSHVGGSTSRATVALSGAGQASLATALGTYDPATGNCTTYCHGSAPSPAWASTGLVCGDCHGLPPATTTGHPVASGLTTCVTCHPDTMNADGTLALSGGKHLNGITDAIGHGAIPLPSQHGPMFFDSLAGTTSLGCKGCHGADYGGGIGPSCNGCHQAAGWSGWTTNCSFCHGTRDASTQAGYAVASHPTWSAPPDAISQRLSGGAAPARTGAHQAHLTGATSGGLQFAAAFSCETCHAVPADLSHVGGSTSRATVTLTGAGQASLPVALGSYDPATGNCTTYCHGTGTSPAWSDTGMVCGACHGLPPAAATGHPTASGLTSCVTCHAETMNADGTLNLSGGKHLNGAVEATGHQKIPAASQHGPMALDYFGGVPGALDCKGCHGADYGGGTGPSCNACHTGAGWTAWATNCSFCHGIKDPVDTMPGYSVGSHPTWSAPPDAVSQRLSGTPALDRTGAHLAHLTGTAQSGESYALPFPCQSCHAVPTDLSHVGGSASRATVALASGSYSQATGTCATSCHGTAAPSPAWSGAITRCDSCHGIAPDTGGLIWGVTAHIFHTTNGINYACQDCHASTASWVVVGGSLVNVLNADKTNHVNGSVDVVFQGGGGWNAAAGTCTALCHDGATMNWR